MKIPFRSRVWQWLKMKFWDKVYTNFSSSNHDLVLVTIRPRLLARIFNNIEVSKIWMERYVNGNGFATWITKQDNQIILVYNGGLFQHLEDAHKKNAEKMKVIPEQFLLAEPKAITTELKKGVKVDLN